MYMQNSQNGGLWAARMMGASALFLTGAIGYSVYVVFELLAGFTEGSSIMGLMDSMMQMTGGYAGMDYSTMDTFYSVVSGMSVVSTLITMLPAIIITVGIWMVFAAAKKNMLPGTAATGLTIIRVITIINLVFSILGLVFLEMFMIIGLAAANTLSGSSYGSYGMGGSVVFVFIVVMLIVAAVSAVEIVFYLKLNGTVRRMRDTLVTGILNCNISVYVEIYCYLAGGLSAVFALISMMSFSIYGFLANAGIATADIAFAILLRRYRAQMGWMLRNPQPVQVSQQPCQGQQPHQEQPSYQEPQHESGSQEQQPRETVRNETDVLPYYNETTVLSGQMVNDGMLQIVRLIRERTKETICINKPSFWIGKEAGKVDYCITDNTAVSRRHALFTIRDNVCYVQDNHSTNRVFVNGHVLEPGVDVPVSDGDRVRMGDEEFTVCIG